jgi:hypothetical protein
VEWIRFAVEQVLYLAVPIVVGLVGIVLLRRPHRPVLARVSNRVFGIALVVVGAVDLVIRLLRATVLR